MLTFHAILCLKGISICHNNLFLQIRIPPFWNQNRCIWVGDDMDAQKRILLDLMNTM